MKRSIYRIDKMPSKKELHKLYIASRLTQKTIAEEFNVSRLAIKSWLKHYNINIRTTAEAITIKKPTKKTLKKLYLDNKKTINDISKIYNVSHGLVINWLKTSNIKTRGKGELNIIKSPSIYTLHKMYILENKTLNQIAKVHQCSISVVKRWLREANIKTLNKQETFKYKLKSIQKQQIKTCLKRYGVKYSSQDNNIYNKIQSNLYKYKNYILPSGKIIKIQGYENYALDYLLTQYKERDIKTGTKCPIISYSYLGKDRKYHPDIFIPKENLIIEVKSPWTLSKQRNINNKKKRVAIKRGYNFMFMIFNRGGYNMRIKTY